MNRLEVLALPFLACLVLTGIHAYLGIHVLSRKVIFVDIALAQIAALGGSVAFLRGDDPSSPAAYFWSLSFAVGAAAVFALTRTRTEEVPQEAVIGLTYHEAAEITGVPEGTVKSRVFRARQSLVEILQPGVGDA